MAPSANERGMKLDHEILPVWTRGDESENEGNGQRSAIRKQQKRRYRRTNAYEEEGVIRAETHQIDAATEFNNPEPTGIPEDFPSPPPPFPPPPPPPPTTSTASTTETASSITEGPTSSTDVPTVTSAESSESTSSTSETIPPLDQITEAPPLPEPTDEPEPAEDPDSDSDSGDSGDASGPDSDSDDDDNDFIDDPVEADPVVSPTEITSFLPSETATSSGISATSTSFEPPAPTLDAVQQARQQHHRNVETALTVVGTVCGAAFLIIGAFIFWRIMKRRRRRNEALDGAHPVSLPPKPSRGERVLAKVPFLRDRLGNQSWVGITDASAFDEKRRQPSQTPSLDLLGYLPDQPAPAVLMARGGQVPVDRPDDNGQEQQYFGLQYGHYQGSPPSYYNVAGAQKPAISPISTDHQRPARESAYQPSETDSSLSSAFGTGTHIPPTPIHPLHPPPALRQREINLPEPEEPPNTRRETTYTRASIASSVPRFRTIHSWVRQQTNRPFQQRPDSQMEGGRTGDGSSQV